VIGMRVTASVCFVVQLSKYYVISRARVWQTL